MGFMAPTGAFFTLSYEENSCCYGPAKKNFKILPPGGRTNGSSAASGFKIWRFSHCRYVWVAGVEPKASPQCSWGVVAAPPPQPPSNCMQQCE